MNDKELFGQMLVKGLNADIHLLTKGDSNGVPVLFLPGITSYSMSFSEILKRMPDHFYCLSMDIRGRGKSSWPKQGYRMQDYVEDLLNVVNALTRNQTAPFLVGHSMGARIAAGFGSAYSSLISGMVLIDPPVTGPGHRQVYPNSLSMFLEQKAAADEEEWDKFRAFYPHFTEEQRKIRITEYLNVSKEAIIESYNNFIKEPFQVHVKLTTCPMLLLAAELGDTIRPDELAELKSLNSRLQAVVVNGVGHMVYKEAPQVTAESIISFISDHLK
ncbi:alpha/beta fold hydrolase [Brevibacillus sp. B_LB10_24]|uniref:alpha/beta fold hydrolase n=1 Tax=Brevibacillus sp. B_LB10_24 TaxID=3380645 RepID=UPI0038BBFE55